MHVCACRCIWECIFKYLIHCYASHDDFIAYSKALTCISVKGITYHCVCVCEGINREDPHLGCSGPRLVVAARGSGSSWWGRSNTLTPLPSPWPTYTHTHTGQHTSQHRVQRVQRVKGLLYLLALIVGNSRSAHCGRSACKEEEGEEEGDVRAVCVCVCVCVCALVDAYVCL